MFEKQGLFPHSSKFLHCWIIAFSNMESRDCLVIFFDPTKTD